MIHRITIQNVALIEKAEIDFCRGLNILSGETGAGKSVILDSVNFVLGAKADRTMIRHGAEFCFVSAEFDVDSNSSVGAELEDLGVEYDDTIVISRKFTQEGKSVIRLNGMPVNGTMLRRITANLVDVHGQSEHFFLLKESNQLKVIDRCVGSALERDKEVLAGLIGAYRECKEKIVALGTDDAERERRLDVLSFQIRELKDADLKEGEEEELISSRNKMNSVEKILTALNEAQEALEADGGGMDALRMAKRSLGGIVALDGQYAELENRLDGLQAEAEDVAERLSALADRVEFDEGELQRIENRLAEIRLLKKKYGGSIENALQFCLSAEREYDLLVNSARELERLNGEKQALAQQIYTVCRAITDKRKEAAKDFTARVIRELKTLNIPSAQFNAEFNDYAIDSVDKAGKNGLDMVRFVFSANAGEPTKPLSQIISGGEMSRFMLAVKTQLSFVNEIPTYIFDEIDAGISGQTAKVVAEKFAEIARTTQVVAVSHLAQIACMADKEFLIRKTECNDKTKTEVLEVSGKERIGEIVRLLGGDSKEGYAEKHAERLLHEAEEYKSSLGR